MLEILVRVFALTHWKPLSNYSLNYTVVNKKQHKTKNSFKKSEFIQ